MNCHEPEMREAGREERVDLAGLSNQLRNLAISSGRRSAGGGWLCTFSRPTGPETTDMGPVRSSRRLFA